MLTMRMDQALLWHRIWRDRQLRTSHRTVQDRATNSSCSQEMTTLQIILAKAIFVHQIAQLANIGHSGKFQRIVAQKTPSLSTMKMPTRYQRSTTFHFPRNRAVLQQTRQLGHLLAEISGACYQICIRCRVGITSFLKKWAALIAQSATPRCRRIGMRHYVQRLKRRQSKAIGFSARSQRIRKMVRARSRKHLWSEWPHISRKSIRIQAITTKLCFNTNQISGAAWAVLTRILESNQTDLCTRVVLIQRELQYRVTIDRE